VTSSATHKRRNASPTHTLTTLTENEMIDPEVFDESVERAARKHCGTTFDNVIAALVGFGLGVATMGFGIWVL
jgi:hypothetical protein